MEPIIGGAGKPQLSDDGRPLICDTADCCSPDPCAKSPSIYTDCEAREHLRCMYAYATITFETAQEEGVCDFSVLDGTFLAQCPTPPGCEIGERISTACFQLLNEDCVWCAADEVSDQDVCINCCLVIQCLPGATPEDPDITKITLFTNCGSEGVDEDTECSTMAYGEFELTEVESGLALTLEDASGEGAGASIPCECPRITSAVVTFYGRHCDEPECENPPTALFSATRIGSCQYLIKSLSVANCNDTGTGSGTGTGTDEEDELLTCIYSNGHEGCDEWIYDIAATDCGEQTVTLKLRVFDRRGCSDEFEMQLQCCPCEDSEGSCGPCCDEVDGEEPELQVDVNECDVTVSIGNSENACGTVFLASSLEDIEACTCEQLKAGDCPGVTPIGGIGTAATFGDLEYYVCNKYCDCCVQHIENIPDDDDCCVECNCCNGCLRGMVMTVEGVSAHGANPECTCCENLNGAPVSVPSDGTCGGGVTGVPLCPDPELCGIVTARYSWNIFCDEDPENPAYWIRLGFRTEPSCFGFFQHLGDVYLGATKPGCVPLEGSVEIDDGDPFPALCTCVDYIISIAYESY